MREAVAAMKSRVMLPSDTRYLSRLTLFGYSLCWALVCCVSPISTLYSQAADILEFGELNASVKAELTTLKQLIMSSDQLTLLRAQLNTEQGSAKLKQQLPNIHFKTLKFYLSTDKDVEWLKAKLGSAEGLLYVYQRLILDLSPIDINLVTLKQQLASQSGVGELRSKLKSAEGLRALKDQFPHIDLQFLTAVLSSDDSLNAIKAKLESELGRDELKQRIKDGKRALTSELKELQRMLSSQAGTDELLRQLSSDIGQMALQSRLPNVNTYELKRLLASKADIEALKSSLSSAHQVKELTGQLMAGYRDYKAQLIAEAGLGGLRDRARTEALAIKERAQDEVNKLKEKALSEVESLKKQAMSEVNELKQRALNEANQLKDQAVEKVLESLSLVEEDIRGIGIFPNSQGYLDARLHFRTRYLRHYSSALYFDYTTFRTERGEGTSDQSEEQIREYRLDLDLLKGIIPLHDVFSFDTAKLSFEPGLNVKGISQELDGTAVYTNSFDERIFRGEESTYQRLVLSAKAEVSFALGRDLKLDLSGEYIPLIYSLENAKVITSQFKDISPQRLVSVTSGAQASALFTYRTHRIGDYTLQGRLFIDRGLRSASAVIIDGNYSYQSVDRAESDQRDVWLEMVHGMTYLTSQLGFTPSLILGLQHRTLQLDNSYAEQTTYRLGLIVAFD